jgi:hypothetical protein
MKLDHLRKTFEIKAWQAALRIETGKEGLELQPVLPLPA